jgi:4-hydroxybutyryl-CoA dehydratase/vinylacetyl-CoA-Delta-isomerase
MFMSGKDYRESLNAYKASVYVNGRKVKSVAADADLAPGINAIGLTYDYALKPELAPLPKPAAARRNPATPKPAKK